MTIPRELSEVERRLDKLEEFTAIAHCSPESCINLRGHIAAIREELRRTTDGMLLVPREET